MKYRKKLGYRFREFGTKVSGIFYKLKNMKNMDKISITLEGKEYQIDIEKAKELGVLKEKDTRCKSWEEFLNKYQKKRGFYYDDITIRIEYTANPTTTNEQLTEDEAIAIGAFSKLLKLRRDWIGDWNPDICTAEDKFCIIYSCDCIKIIRTSIDSHAFSFPTEEMASEFLKYFWDLFVQCKILI